MPANNTSSKHAYEILLLHFISIRDANSESAILERCGQRVLTSCSISFHESCYLSVKDDLQIQVV